MDTIGQKFRKVKPIQNFLTPDVEGYFQKGNYICELSSGGEFCGKYIFGVSVINEQTMQYEEEKSKCFLHPNEEQAKNDALNYIHNLG